MKIQLIFLMFLIFGCQKKLSKENLIFQNPEKIAIKESGIDTTFILIPNEQKTIKDSKIVILGTPLDSLNATLHGYIVYNDKGDLLEENIYTIMGTTTLYEYNEEGDLRRKRYITDYTEEYLISSEFDPNELQFKQYWEYNKDLKDSDTTVYQFDHKGLLLSETGHFHDDLSHQRTYKKEYIYNKSRLKNINTYYQNDYERLIETRETFEFNKDVINRINKEYLFEGESEADTMYNTEIRYFGSDGLIDSMRTYYDLKYIYRHK